MCIYVFNYTYTKSQCFCIRAILHLYVARRRAFGCIYVNYRLVYKHITFRRDTFLGGKFSQIIDCICENFHVYKIFACTYTCNITSLRDVYTSFFCCIRFVVVNVYTRHVYVQLYTYTHVTNFCIRVTSLNRI